MSDNLPDRMTDLIGAGQNSDVITGRLFGLPRGLRKNEVRLK
jgi:hypothetical protein